MTNSPDSGVRTFLLADLRGYTSFTSTEGDQAAARLSVEFERLVREVVDTNEGSVFGTAGDQVLAVFASARRALGVAVDLQRRLSDSEATGSANGLQAGIGLDAGEAVAVGEDFRGGALNLAARLCSLAGPGEVLTSEAVLHLAGKIPDLTALERGVVQLKGFADPVRVMRVMTASKADGSTRVEQQSPLPIGGFLGALPSGALVGRSDELRRLERAVESVAAGGGRLVMLAGEPGVGKTRLAQEVTIDVRNRGFLVAAGRCYEPREAVAFYPFLETLASLYLLCPLTIRRDVPNRWPYLARLLPEHNLPLPASAESDDDQERLFRAVSGFVSAVAEHHPVALLLDDLHWADASSLELLQHLSRQTRGSQVFMLATYRDVEVNRQHPLSQALRDLQREQLVERVAVKRLEVEETRALIAASMGEAEVSRELGQLVHETTEGNPFFTQEVLRTLVERGDFYLEAGGWQRREIEEIVVPESVRDTIGERLSRLDPSTQEVLLAASVLGQTFGFEELSGLGEWSETELERALEEATATGLLQESGRDAHAFDHALTQQSLYLELSSRRKRRLHMLAGEAIEKLPERRREGREAELAWHFLEGDDSARALNYCLAAGDQAERVYAHVEAERQYRTALELAQDMGDQVRQAQALEKLGNVLRMTSREDEALESLRQAAEMWEALEDGEGQLRVGSRMAAVYAIRFEPDVGLKLIHSVLETTGETKPSAGLAEAYLALVELYFMSGEYEQQLSAAERASELARRIGNDAMSVVAEGRRALALFLLGRADEAVPVLQRVTSVAESSGDLDTLMLALNNLAENYQWQGEFQKMRSYCEYALASAQRIGHPGRIAFATSKLALADIWLGEWEKAVEETDSSLDMGRRVESSWLTENALYMHVMIRILRGDPDDGYEELEDHARRAQESGDIQAVRLDQRVLAERDLLQGRPASALSRMQPLAEGPGGEEKDVLLPYMAEAQIELGDLQGAERMTSEAIQVARDRGYRLILAISLRVQAMVRSRQGRWEEADQSFDEALELFRAFPYPYAQAQTLYDYGVSLQARGESEHARDILAKALTIFERLGARPYRERVEQTLT